MVIRYLGTLYSTLLPHRAAHRAIAGISAQVTSTRPSKMLRNAALQAPSCAGTAGTTTHNNTLSDRHSQLDHADAADASLLPCTKLDGTRQCHAKSTMVLSLTSMSSGDRLHTIAAKSPHESAVLARFHFAEFGQDSILPRISMEGQLRRPFC